MSEATARQGGSDARRADGIAALAAMFGVDPSEVVPLLREQWGEYMTEGALSSAGHAWRENELTPRERSLIVVACILSQSGVEERLRGHLRFARHNGADDAELEELIALSAVYVGYPKATTAMEILREVVAE